MLWVDEDAADLAATEAERVIRRRSESGGEYDRYGTSTRGGIEGW